MASHVQRVLKAQGRSLPWLAKQLDVEHSHLWRMLDGQRPERPGLRREIAKILGVPEDLLFDDAPVDPLVEREAS